MELRLKQARILKGQTIREAAKGLGLSHNGLHKYEKGMIKVDSLMMNKFANYYGVTVDYLIGFMIAWLSIMQMFVHKH